MSHLLLLTRTKDGETEAEPALSDTVGTTVSLTLDDGEILTFDALDLFPSRVDLIAFLMSEEAA